jgi:hypothetical protein
MALYPDRTCHRLHCRGLWASARAVLSGVGFAVLGLFLSIFSCVRLMDTSGPKFAVAHGQRRNVARFQWEIFKRTSLTDRDLSSVSQAGLMNNLNDGMAWGLFPLLYATVGLSLAEIGWLAAIYPAVWGLGQLFTGALSDRTGRKWLIASGMWVQRRESQR